MPRKRKVISNPEECTDEPVRKVIRRRLSKNEPVPVRINKYYLQKAIDKVSHYGKKIKRQHPLIERYGNGGIRCLTVCSSVSVEALCPNLLQPVIYAPTWTLLVNLMRKAILSRNWNFCLRIYDALLKCGALRRRQLMYLLRLIFLIFFNMNVSNERLYNFLTVTLSIRNDEEKLVFLRSLIELKKFSIEKNSQTASTASPVDAASSEEISDTE